MDTASTNGSQVENAMTFWCAGLPYSGERGLTHEEREELKKRLASLRRCCRGFAGASALTLLITLLSIPAWSARSGNKLPTLEPQRIEAMLWVVSIFALIAAMELAIAYRCSRHSSSIALDLKSDAISIYSGVLSERSRLEPTQRTLIASRLLRVDPTDVQTIELLKSSGIIWAVNGRRLRRNLQPTLSEVAPQPRFAAIAAQWLEPIGKHDKATLYGGRRELSESEKQELRKFVRRLITRPASSSLPVAIVSLILAGQMYYNHQIDGEMMFRVFLVGGLSNIGVYLFQIRQARRFGDDLRVGYVGIRRIEAAEPAGTMSEPDIEFLPVTGMLWTKSGEPAVWRRGST